MLKAISDLLPVWDGVIEFDGQLIQNLKPNVIAKRGTMVDFSPSEEMRALRETVQRFVHNELQPLEQEIEESGRLDTAVARQITAKSVELGLYAMNMPHEHGGGGLNAVENCMVEELAGWTSDILARRAFGNVYDILLACNAEQRERWLLPTVRGERVVSIAITEPGAGSDAAAIKTRAIDDSSGWLLNGHKHFASDGEYADYFVVSSVTNERGGDRGISMFLVDKALPGVTVGRNQAMMGLRGTTHVELFFEDVKLTPDTLLGTRGEGLRLILETVGQIRLAHVGARAVGTATRLLSMMIEHARSREQFGRSIGQFQMVQSMLSDSAIEINAARMMVLNAAWEIDQGLEPREKISMVKVYAAEMACRVADRAIQIHGGLGFSKALPIERLYRDLRVARIYDGTSEIHRGIIARGLLDKGIDILTPPVPSRM